MDGNIGVMVVQWLDHEQVASSCELASMHALQSFPMNVSHVRLSPFCLWGTSSRSTADEENCNQADVVVQC